MHESAMSLNVTPYKRKKWRASQNVVSQTVNVTQRIAATAQNQAIARRLIATRNALDLTQAQFAEAMGTERTTLANWENRWRTPDVLAIVRLHEPFGVTLDWIFRGDMSGLRHSLAVKLQHLLSASSQAG